MAYVILNPHSNTNPSEKYRVVFAEDWTAYINGARKSAPIAGSFEDYKDAEKLRDELNKS